MACCIPSCGPSCAIPSCASTPVVGLGPCGPTSGIGGGLIGGGLIGSGGVSSSSLGIYPGAQIGCITQIPSSEVVIQPPSSVVTIPGPILSASCEPVAVGGYNPCASGYSGYGLGSYGGYLGGGYLGGGYKGLCRPKRKFSICGSPC